MKHVFCLAAVLALFAACSAIAQDAAAPAAPAAPEKEQLAPLKITLPKPMFVGTPKNIASDNLEEPTGMPREPFMAPVGAENVAKGKPVTASDKEPIIGEPELITDGDKDGSDGCFIEFGPGTQWVQIDLGKPCTLYAIVFWHYHSQARVYHDVVVQVADDDAFTKNIRTLFNNDIDNSSGLGAGKDKEYVETYEGKLVDAKGVKAQYIRLYSKGNTSDDLNHYVEVEAYGKPAE